MSSATDFLFQGTPPANLTTTSTDTSSLPAWYQSYLQGLMSTSNAIAATPYQQYTGPRLADFNTAQQTAFDQAANASQAGAASTAGAQGALTSAVNTDVTGAVSPYLTAASTAATPTGIQSYMSPYINNQIAGLTDTAMQNWNQFTAPGIKNSFIGAGQYGSGRNAEVFGQQANLANRSLTDAIASALNSAWGTAGTQAANQGNILNTAAGTAGTAAQQEGALQTAAGTALGTLGQTQQTEALQQAAANQAIGNQQQAQTQSNLDLAYQDFQNQNNWDKTQASFMSDIIRGIQNPGQSDTKTSTSPAAVTSPSIANVLSTLDSSKSYAQGGRVSGGAQPSNPFAGLPQDRASRTPDGGMYVPRPILDKVAFMLAQKAGMGKGASGSGILGMINGGAGGSAPVAPPPTMSRRGALSMGVA